MFDSISHVLPKVQSVNPLSFETLDQSYGFILYEHVLSPAEKQPNDPALLSIPGLRDRGQVFVDEVSIDLSPFFFFFFIFYF